MVMQAPDQSTDEGSTNTVASKGGSPLKFFFLVFVLSVPFWWIGARTGRQLLPGLPAASLMFACPAAAALFLAYRKNKAAGVTALLRRAFDYKRIGPKIWYAPIILLMPAVTVLSFGLQRWMAVPVPVPRFKVVQTLGLLLVFFVSALGEELGWSGYGIDPVQDRWGALPASLLVGSVWAIWHSVPLVQAHRSAAWIGWWCVYTVAARVLIVWLYNNTGRNVFATVLFHMTLNVTWQLYPIRGSYWDPRVIGLITASVAAIVTMKWGRAL